MIDFFMNNLPWFWVCLLVLCLIVEAFTFSLTTIWASMACLPLVFIAKTSMQFKWQLFIFILITVFMLIFTRPFAVKKLKVGSNKTNVDNLAGEEVVIVKAISLFQKGEVKTKNGVIWSAISKDGKALAKGEVAKISSVQGNTLVVESNYNS
ncbi:NfeD family protein [Treponema pectinovorum]|uniref:NfeD family protein n=1 Tax=Treponema pectinovorum TaxID=164 RepID=UPI0011CB11A3|nr:NfeD family protein [Treponema pectinovorum]